MLQFIETTVFSRQRARYLSDDDYAVLQWTLALNPQAGEVIRGSGGVRKLRWPGSGRGKRGGLRVIYWARMASGQIALLTVYAKGEAADIPPSMLAAIKREIES